MESSRRAPVRSHKFSRSQIGLTMLAGFITLSALGTVTAQAQYGYEPDLILPPRAVVWRLNDRGFTEVTRPRFDGRAYIVEATGPYGDRVRLFVDARDGAVLDRQRLGAPLPPAPIPVARPAAPGYGWTEADEQPRQPMREAARPVPPGRIPNGDGVSRQPRFDVAARPDAPARAEPADRNPLGLNPDARTGDARRPAEPAPARKVTRLAPPAKAAAPRLAPEAPLPGRDGRNVRGPDHHASGCRHRAAEGRTLDTRSKSAPPRRRAGSLAQGSGVERSACGQESRSGHRWRDGRTGIDRQGSARRPSGRVADVVIVTETNKGVERRRLGAFFLNTLAANQPASLAPAPCKWGSFVAARTGLSL